MNRTSIIIIPAYNEDSTISKVVKNCKQYGEHLAFGSQLSHIRLMGSPRWAPSRVIIDQPKPKLTIGPARPAHPAHFSSEPRTRDQLKDIQHMYAMPVEGQERKIDHFNVQSLRHASPQPREAQVSMNVGTRVYKFPTDNTSQVRFNRKKL